MEILGAIIFGVIYAIITCIHPTKAKMCVNTVILAVLAPALYFSNKCNASPFVRRLLVDGWVAASTTAMLMLVVTLVATKKAKSANK